MTLNKMGGECLERYFVIGNLCNVIIENKL